MQYATAALFVGYFWAGKCSSPEVGQIELRSV